MRDFSEYKDIFSKLSKKEVAYAKEYLMVHPKLSLHDIYYTSGVNDKYQKWRDYKDIRALNNWIIALKERPIDKNITYEKLIDYVDDFDVLHDHIYEYAEENLSENSLMDKSHTMDAINAMDVDILYECDTEVRENFIICCQGGMESLKAEIEKHRKNIECSEQSNEMKSKETTR